MGYFEVRYDPRVVIYNRRAFFRLTTAQVVHLLREVSFQCDKIGRCIGRVSVSTLLAKVAQKFWSLYA